MNSRKSWIRVAAVAASGLLFLTACSSSDETATETSAAATTEETATEEAAAECTELTPVTLQLQWFVQAQFGGYYAAKDLGYYEEQCLDVTILEGGVDIVPQTVLAQGGADYAISWVPKALASREQGAGIVDVAQVFRTSGTLQVSWADSNITTAADLAATPLWLKDAEAEPAASGNKRWLAISGVLLAILLLGSQLIHHNREVLATDPNYGETVRKVYELLNRPLYPAWELSAYKIRSSEAIYGESTKDFLDIRAQLAVTGDRPMGEPEIKVILKDRWGSPLNTWMFTPDKYMQGMRPPNGLIQPGTLIPLTLSVLDPGSAAQGFELAVCVRREGGVLQCSGQQ